MATVGINPLDVDPEQVERKHQIDQYCRLCLCEPLTLIPLRSVFGSVPVPAMFAAVTGVTIDLDDQYPKKLCTVCLGKLETAYGIRKEFLDNVATLESYFVGVAKGEFIVKEEHLDDSEGEIVVKQEMSDDHDYENMEMSIEEGESSGSEYEPEYVEVAESSEPTKRTRKTTKKRKSRKKIKIVGEASVMDPLKCYVCEAGFVDSRELNSHLAKHADMLPYTCEPCVSGGGYQKKKITTVVMLHRHIKMHAGTIDCPHCPIRTFNKNRLEAHIKRYHREHSRAEFTCEKCGFQMHSKESYQAHMVRHDAVEDGRYTCLICDRKFGNSSRLKRHLLTHEDSKQYQCQYCEKSISSKTLLLTHEREHVDAGELKQYACAFCDKRFSNRSTQTQHINTHHPETVARRKTDNGSSDRLQENLKCPFENCNYVATSYQTLYNHRNRYHVDKYVCTFCDDKRRFANKQQLTVHMNSHLEKSDRPFACGDCDRKFSSQKNLNDHVRSHTGERPYLCPECGESFFTSQRLAHHVLKHAPPQHKCQFCDKEFRYKGDYVRHVKKHEEEAVKEGPLDDF